MVRFLILSVLIHAGLAGTLAWYLATASEPTAVATLDLSSVELSFAEEERESEPNAVPTVPSRSGADQMVAKTTPPPSLEMPLGDDGVAVPPLPPEPEMTVRQPPPEIAIEKNPHRHSTLNAQHSSLTSAAAPRQARVDAPPKPLRAIRPDYPRSARQRGEQGDVVLEIAVAADGTVNSVAVVTSSGFAALDEAAVKAARSARFSPAKSENRAIDSTARLTLTFKLK